MRRLWKKLSPVPSLPEKDRRVAILLVNSLVSAKAARGLHRAAAMECAKRLLGPGT